MLRSDTTMPSGTLEDGVRIVHAANAETVRICDEMGDTRVQFDMATNTAEWFGAGCELRFRVIDGKLQIAASQGVQLITKGAIELRADQGLRMVSGDTSLELTPDGARWSAENLALASENVNFTGRTVKATLARLSLTASRVECFADRIFQHARQSYQRIEMLWHTRAGRIRTESAGAHLMQARDVRVVAEEETRIQARSINLG